MSKLKSQVEHIISNLENGIEITEDDLHYDDNYEVGDMLSGYDYLTDALDIEYITTSDKQYKGARVLVCFGGPNVWINTRTQQVEGYWWGEQCIMSYSKDLLDLDACLHDLFECQ
jgi:hypothetical protein